MLVPPLACMYVSIHTNSYKQAYACTQKQIYTGSLVSHPYSVICWYIHSFIWAFILHSHKAQTRQAATAIGQKHPAIQTAALQQRTLPMLVSISLVLAAETDHIKHSTVLCPCQQNQRSTTAPPFLFPLCWSHEWRHCQ